MWQESCKVLKFRRRLNRANSFTVSLTLNGQNMIFAASDICTTMETMRVFPTFDNELSRSHRNVPVLPNWVFRAAHPRRVWVQLRHPQQSACIQLPYGTRIKKKRTTKAQKWCTLFSFGPRLCVLLQLQSSTVSSSATDWSSALPQQLSEQSPAQLLQLSRCVSLLPPHAHSTLEHRLNQSLSRFHTLPQISSTLNKFCLKKKANYYDKAQVCGT